MESRLFYSHGKLLISGEYLVLDGALALAVPVKLGQSLLIEECDTPGLHWIADQHGGTWFEAFFDLPGLEIKHSTDAGIASYLRKLLESARNMQQGFLFPGRNYRVSTFLEFNRFWGLGSSSTLLTNLARWAGIDPFTLHVSVSKGSGYDVACASASGPLLYSLVEKKPLIKPVRFQPWFKDSIYFVYLGKKQNSETAIAGYRKKQEQTASALRRVSDISEAMLSAESLEVFQQLMDEHEAIVSKILDAPRIQDIVFNKFPGTAKSLGAWGGDFAMLATDIGEPELKKQLLLSGLKTWFSFEELLLQHL